MSLYVEGDVPFVSNGNGNNGMWGSDGIWAILLLALLGGRGFGFGGQGGYGGGYGCGCSDNLAYHLGQVATTNDVASGFSTSEIMSDLNSIIVGQANMQNWINQGFYGIDRTILQGFNGVDNAICTLGYQNQQGFNNLSHQLSDCCCATQRAIDGVNYNMATNTSQIVQAINCGNQRVIDYMQNEKIDSLNRKLLATENALNQCQNNAYLINQIKPCPIPSFNVPNPNCCYNGCSGCGNGF